MYSRETLFSRVDGLKEVFEAFLAEFGDEDFCRDYVLAMVVETNVMRCNHCGTSNKPTVIEDRNFPCIKCKRPIWITAGTMFEQVEYFQSWLAAFRLHEKKIILNPFQFHILLGIHYNTAYTMFKQLNKELSEMLTDCSRTVPSSAFVSVFYRRSRETPAGEPPVSEERRARQLAEKPLLMKRKRKVRQPMPSMQQTPLDLNEREKLVYSETSATPISFELLCKNTDLPVPELSSVLTMLELKGALNRLPGDNYERADFQTLVAAKDLSVDRAVVDKGQRRSIKSFIEFIKSKYQGISRKYLQLYVGPHLLNESVEGLKDGTLLTAFIKRKKITSKEILDFVTDLQVAIFPRAPAGDVETT
ncbi:MAG TPA: hypothetical protein EYN91_04390 [Candidatus Melainabacteria bacterium]|nr:hypothetical protein [Candidatus Melainabacteria bacterium]HIN66114.1 hypothetical protein [Candidatus Obscuribacterales bacterium]